jgi:hypothetical protein
LSEQILMIAIAEHARPYAAELGTTLGRTVRLESHPRVALTLLRQHEYAAVVVEEALVQRDGVWAATMWQHCGTAQIVPVNLGICSASRVALEVKAALVRRRMELERARTAAYMEVGRALRSTVTGVLLESELALREKDLPRTAAEHLQHVVALAEDMRRALERTA